MHAIPSAISLRRTASCTSSVMSVTVSPPVVRSCFSCWKTFMPTLFCSIRARLAAKKPQAGLEAWASASGGAGGVGRRGGGLSVGVEGHVEAAVQPDRLAWVRAAGSVEVERRVEHAVLHVVLGPEPGGEMAAVE